MPEDKEKKLPEIKKEAEEKNCPVNQALYFVEEFLAGPMCGKCFPCEMGTYEARVRLRGLTAGIGSEGDLIVLRKIADEMSVTSRCKKGKDTAAFLLEWLDSDIFAEHVQKHCPASECLALIQYKVIPEACINCDKCREVCKDNAVIGEKNLSYKSGDVPYDINQVRCTRCGECIKVCPTSAIEMISLRAAVNEEIKV